MIARRAFDAFISLDRSARFAALQFARERRGQAVPVIEFVDIVMAQAWRDPFADSASVKVVRAHSALALRAHNDT